MKVGVLIKQVPDSDDVKMDAEKGTMIRSGVGNIINPLDLNAVQAAVDIKAARGCEITVITMGPPQAEDALREALALGADEAVLLSDSLFAGADSLATAFALSRALIQTGPYDLILAGEKATDGETGQVGPETATFFGVPCATYVSEFSLRDEAAVVKRSIEYGVQRQQITLPCLLTLLNDVNEPEMPTLAGKKRSRRANIIKLTARDLNLDKKDVGLAGSPTKVVKIYRPKIARTTSFYDREHISEGVEAVVSLVKELALI